MFPRDFGLSGGVYMIGIGGVSMSALACLLSDRGVRVRGSDRAESPLTRRLIARGIPVHIGEEEEIREETVVCTAAIPAEHPQRKRAEEAGKRLLTRARLLGMVAGAFPHVISVAGSHGKTSCTAMLAHVFAAAGLPFTCHIGGEDLDFGNYVARGEEYFITEACEYRRSFLSLSGGCAVVLNIDRDHMDCYGSEEALCGAFRSYVSAAEFALVNGDDPRARALPHRATFGVTEGDFRAVGLYADGERYSFRAAEGDAAADITLGVCGRVYVEDAMAAYAAARSFGIPPATIAAGLRSFRGVRRRFEFIGFLCGAPVISDYAHHPREMRAALSTAQAICRGTVRLVFQPHTYSRTKDLMREFADVLREAESPVLYATYAAREPFDGEGSAAALAGHVPEAVYVQSPAQLRGRLQGLIGKGDLVLVLGAGDIDAIARSVLDQNSAGFPLPSQAAT